MPKTNNFSSFSIGHRFHYVDESIIQLILESPDLCVTHVPGEPLLDTMRSFLGKLRDSDLINMLGAPYALAAKFRLPLDFCVTCAAWWADNLDTPDLSSRDLLIQMLADSKSSRDERLTIIRSLGSTHIKLLFGLTQEQGDEVAPASVLSSDSLPEQEIVLGESVARVPASETSGPNAFPIGVNGKSRPGRAR